MNRNKVLWSMVDRMWW